MALYQGIIYFDIKPIQISPNERFHAQMPIFFVHYFILVVLLLYVDAILYVPKMLRLLF